MTLWLIFRFFSPDVLQRTKHICAYKHEELPCLGDTPYGSAITTSKLEQKIKVTFLRNEFLFIDF